MAALRSKRNYAAGRESAYTMFHNVGMESKKRQYTIRGVSSEVDKALRLVARERRMSLNGYLVQELERIAEAAEEPVRYHDLDFAIGSMKDGEQVDEALKEFERIDEHLWQ